MVRAELVVHAVPRAAHELVGWQQGVVDVSVVMDVVVDGVLVHDVGSVHPLDRRHDHVVRAHRGTQVHEPRAQCLVPLRREVVPVVLAERGEGVFEQEDVAVDVEHGVAEEEEVAQHGELQHHLVEGGGGPHARGGCRVLLGQDVVLVVKHGIALR